MHDVVDAQPFPLSFRCKLSFPAANVGRDYHAKSDLCIGMSSIGDEHMVPSPAPSVGATDGDDFATHQLQLLVRGIAERLKVIAADQVTWFLCELLVNAQGCRRLR